MQITPPYLQSLSVCFLSVVSPENECGSGCDSVIAIPCVSNQEWSPSHNLKSLKKKQMAAREAIARQTVSDAEQSIVESSVIRSAL